MKLDWSEEFMELVTEAAKMRDMTAEDFVNGIIQGAVLKSLTDAYQQDLIKKLTKSKDEK